MSGLARTPAAHRTVCVAIVSAPISTWSAPMSVTIVFVRTSMPRRSSWALALADSASGKDERIRGPASMRRDARRTRIEVAEVARERTPRDLGERARHLDARGTAAHDDERRLRAPLLGRGLELCRLEGAQDAPSDVQRLADRLEPGRVRGPLVVPEVGVGHPRRQDQVVVVDVPTSDQHPLLFHLDALHARHEHRRVRLAPEQLANGCRDVGRGERRRRDLVQQRLEEMVIAAVDDRDAYAGAIEGARRRETAEASPQDHDVGLFLSSAPGTSLATTERDVSAGSKGRWFRGEWLLVTERGVPRAEGNGCNGLRAICLYHLRDVQTTHALGARDGALPRGLWRIFR